MSLLAGVNYDPATQVVKSCAANLAMTALDTTNLRLTFQAPTSGNVLVRLRGGLFISSYPPAAVMLGVLEGATIKVRGVPLGQINTYIGGASIQGIELMTAITGLSPGSSYTWDAAYGIENPNSSTSLRYGGPNDATAQNANGAFTFEVWTA